jgi:hypothetical protein
MQLLEESIIMLARFFATAALLLAAVSALAVPESAAAAENEPAKSDNTATTVKGDASGLATEGQRGTESPKSAPRATRILFITAKDCEQCAAELAKLRKPGGDFESMQSRGWKIGEGPENHIQIVDRDAIPELVLQLNVREYPTVACISNGEIIRSFKDGCSTPLDAWTFGWLIKGEWERPQAVIPEAIRVKSTGSYRLRGNHWSVEGDWNPSREKVIGHIRGPHGSSQLAASYAIDGWSYEELRSLHDDIHEREGGGSVAASGYYSGYYQAPQPRGANQFSAGRKMMGL